MLKDLVEIQQLPLIPKDWDYEISIEKISPLLYQWKNLTLEIATELYIANEILSSPGCRTDLVSNETRLPTFEEYCREIAMPKVTAYRLIWAVFGKKQILSPPLPKLESQVLYADPPWSYHNEGFEESAVWQYPTLTLEQICNFTDPNGKKIKQLAVERAVLFLWVTYPLVPEGVEVIKAWGFQYKAQMVWIKNKTLPIGWWVKPRHELLFIASKGDEVHPAIKYDSIFEADVTAHSAKPQIVYEWIEAMYTGPYIELFARNTRPGWESWGNELT